MKICKVIVIHNLINSYCSHCRNENTAQQVRPEAICDENFSSIAIHEDSCANHTCDLA
jgi:hypothetical protein